MLTNSGKKLFKTLDKTDFIGYTTRSFQKGYKGYKLVAYTVTERKSILFFLSGGPAVWRFFPARPPGALHRHSPFVAPLQNYGGSSIMFERSRKAASNMKRLIAVAAVPALSVLALSMTPHPRDVDAFAL